MKAPPRKLCRAWLVKNVGCDETRNYYGIFSLKRNAQKFMDIVNGKEEPEGFFPILHIVEVLIDIKPDVVPFGIRRNRVKVRKLWSVSI
jgi:hypothetical protein